MVQKELESQATQLIEHCQYGLEQVEAEKLLLVAGKFILSVFNFIFLRRFKNDKKCCIIFFYCYNNFLIKYHPVF